MTRVLTFFRLTTRLAIVTVPLAALLYATPVLAASAPSLGAAGSFVVLAGAGASCSGGSIAGNVGAGTVVTRVGCSITGNVSEHLATNSQARQDFGTAYRSLEPSPPCDGVHKSGTLAGETLFPGTYCLSAEEKTGILTLDAQGNSDAVWIFQIGTGTTPGHLTGALTGTNFHVVMAGQGQACNVYWWVAEAATMTTSNFQGTILAGSAISFTGGTLIGRALAGAAVTFTEGTVVTGCATTGGGGGGGDGGGGGGDNNGNGGGDDHQGDGGGDNHQGDGGGDNHQSDGGGDNQDGNHGHHGGGSREE